MILYLPNGHLFEEKVYPPTYCFISFQVHNHPDPVIQDAHTETLEVIECCETRWLLLGRQVVRKLLFNIFPVENTSGP